MSETEGRAYWESPIRWDTLEMLNAYVKDGVPPGDFGQAVLENNLIEAFGRADEGNRATLFFICGWLFNYAPSDCFGNPERVKAWIEKNRKEREGT